MFLPLLKIMSLRIYDILENTTKELDTLQADTAVTKTDVIQQVRSRLVQIMTHVITTPTIGEEYAYPGDIDLSPWVDTTIPYR